MGCRKTISIGKRGLRGLMLWTMLTFEIKFLNNKSFKQKPRSYFHEGLKNLINCGIICFLNMIEGGMRFSYFNDWMIQFENFIRNLKTWYEYSVNPYLHMSLSQSLCTSFILWGIFMIQVHPTSRALETKQGSWTTLCTTTYFSANTSLHLNHAVGQTFNLLWHGSPIITLLNV